MQAEEQKRLEGLKENPEKRRARQRKYYAKHKQAIKVRRVLFGMVA